MWIYIDPETAKKIEEICDSNYPVCSKCPLASPCDAEKEEWETTGEYTRRWETAMARAARSIKAGK